MDRLSDFLLNVNRTAQVSREQGRRHGAAIMDDQRLEKNRFNQESQDEVLGFEARRPAVAVGENGNDEDRRQVSGERRRDMHVRLREVVPVDGLTGLGER